MKKLSLLIVSLAILTLQLGVTSCESKTKKTTDTSVQADDSDSQLKSQAPDEPVTASPSEEKASDDSVTASQSQEKASDDPVTTLKKGNMYAEIYTKHGVMKVKFYEKDAPATVANFVKLAKSGFYNGLTFHRVIPNFVIQGEIGRAHV